MRTPTLIYSLISLALISSVAWAVDKSESRPPREETILENIKVQARLSINSANIPYISKIVSQETGAVIFTGGDNLAPQDWLGETGLPNSDAQPLGETGWSIKKTPQKQRAFITRALGVVECEWAIELIGDNPMFRQGLSLTNKGKTQTAVEAYPIWLNRQRLDGDAPVELKTWRALSYEPVRQNLAGGDMVRIGSSMYSSNEGKEFGEPPFWSAATDKGALFYSLGWCGGWRARFSRDATYLSLSVNLPSEETGLTLQPGERIDGPWLYVSASPDDSEMISRREWLMARRSWTRTLFSKPPDSPLLIYNHWYSVRFDLSGDFIRSQVDALSPYGFDYFVVDAGWYEAVGRWTPHKEKFQPGEFENALKYVRDQGVGVGIWSCPWLIEVDKEKAKKGEFPPEVDDPPFYRPFMNAYGLDLAGTDFSSRLEYHVRAMSENFGARWWKYDQEFFHPTASRHGKMKNVTALQNALGQVRLKFPDLRIENCMSGGRMINQFTDQIANCHWIRDGGGNGRGHGRSNLREALGAVQFLHPNRVMRWTNRPDEIDSEDGDLFRFYCRSAMIGVWGICADMSRISKKQREILKEEIALYRDLSRLKEALNYEVIYPGENGPVAGIAYYDGSFREGAILLFRWSGEEKIRFQPETPLRLHGPIQELRIGNGRDERTARRLSGDDLTARKNGNKTNVFKPELTIPRGQSSAVYFYKPAE